MDKKLIDILNEHSMPFSNENINKIMDEELEKDVDEIDTDLIDACLDALGVPFGNIDNGWAEFEKAGKQAKRIKIGKVIPVAVIIAIIMSVAVPVSAKFLNVNASNKIVQYQGDHFDVDLNGNDKEFSVKGKNNLKSILEKEGFDNVALPKAFYQNDYTIINSDKYMDDSNHISIELDNKSNDIKAYIDIIDLTDYNFAFSSSQLHTDYTENIEQIDINDMTVLVYGNDDYISIRYINRDINYNIILENCDFEKAKLIAMTL